jgi:hypothetical protein
VARLKKGGGASGAHWKGGLMAVATLDSSRLVTDSMGEADKRRRRVTGKVAAWFALAGVTWSRGSEGGARGGFPTEAERRNKEGKVGAGLGAPPGEEKEGGGGSSDAGKAVGARRCSSVQFQWRRVGGGSPARDGNGGVWAGPGRKENGPNPRA